MHTNFEKRKISQAVGGNFVQKWLFCKIYVLFYLALKFLENTFEVVQT